MISYKTNAAGEITYFNSDKYGWSNFLGSELLLVTSVLCDKKWGKTPVDGKLRSERWWRNKKQNLINMTNDIDIKPTIPFPDYIEPPPPIRYEDEYFFKA